MSAEEYGLDPDNVVDRDSFVRFVMQLIEDRLEAEKMEMQNPQYYSLGGARGWQNSSISAFLECALAGAEEQNDWVISDTPTWRGLALFLYLGKIYE